MNKTLAVIGSAAVTATVLLFAVFLITGFTFGSYAVCMILPMGYIMMAEGLRLESAPDRRAAADLGMAFAVIYAVIILLVYFAQTTSLRSLGSEAAAILDYRRGGLMFNYDLLGYGMMALSTFFLGLSMRAKTRLTRWLSTLLMLHGLFFFGCFIMPMTGAFRGMADGSESSGGTVALIAWCAYFLPIGALALAHFLKKEK